MKKERVCLMESAQERLTCLREAQEKDEGDPRAPLRIEDMWFGRDYIAAMEETLQKIVDGQDIDYQALCRSISLEMIANSNGWSSLRYYARKLCR